MAALRTGTAEGSSKFSITLVLGHCIIRNLSFFSSIHWHEQPWDLQTTLFLPTYICISHKIAAGFFGDSGS
eukprot:c35534_g1_i1 orf=93-305(-)